MSDLQVSGPVQKLRRWGDLGVLNSFRVPNEIVPVVLVDDLSENTPPRPCAAWDAQAAVAAQHSTVGISNPASSGVIVRVTQVSIRVGSAVDFCNFKLGGTFPGIAATSRASWRDRRLDGAPAAEMALGSAVALLNGEQVDRIRVPTANESVIVPVDYWIQPGVFFLLENNTVNSSLDIGLVWTEENQVEHGAVG